MPIFVFYLWRHLWQTFRTAANFLYNSSFSRNTRFLISGQVFNQSLQKLVQMKSTCFKTLKLQNFMRLLSQNIAVLTPVVTQSTQNWLELGPFLTKFVVNDVITRKQGIGRHQDFVMFKNWHEKWIAFLKYFMVIDTDLSNTVGT